MKRWHINWCGLPILVLAIGWAGCTTTVIPKPLHDTEASWDGNVQNSGFIEFLEDGSALITLHARDRYNVLVDHYGVEFTPPLSRDAGLTPSPSKAGFLIDAEHLVKFATMNRWRKQGKP